jgi:hypothetical protein
VSWLKPVMGRSTEQGRRLAESREERTWPAELAKIAKAGKSAAMGSR